MKLDLSTVKPNEIKHVDSDLDIQGITYIPKIDRYAVVWEDGVFEIYLKDGTQEGYPEQSIVYKPGFPKDKKMFAIGYNQYHLTQTFFSCIEEALMRPCCDGEHIFELTPVGLPHKYLHYAKDGEWVENKSDQISDISDISDGPTTWFDTNMKTSLDNIKAIHDKISGKSSGK